MPIYEYLCRPCNCIYNFFVQRPSDNKTPVCPKCGSDDMHKRVSTFAVGHAAAKKGHSEDAAAEPGADALDDPRVEREMMKLMSQAENVDEHDPRQIGRLMRRMSEITGEEMDNETEEAVRRLEAGEDPEAIEEKMGDVFGEPEQGGSAGAPPAYDDGLYSM